MASVNSDELFDSSEQTKSKKQPTPKQLIGIRKGSVKKYFCDKWQEKYGSPYLLPANVFGLVDRPVSDALSKGYTVEQLCKAIDTYLADEWEGYVERSHSIKYFTKDIMIWINKTKKAANALSSSTSPLSVQEAGEAKKLNDQYGILKRGNLWETEDGKKFLRSEDAVRHAQRKGTSS